MVPSGITNFYDTVVLGRAAGILAHRLAKIEPTQGKSDEEEWDRYQDALTVYVQVITCLKGIVEPGELEEDGGGLDER
jgi:hypothetical protein